MPNMALELGFFNKIGSDSWDSFKNLLAKIIRRKAQHTSEAILEFSFSILHDGKTYNAILLATGP